MTFKQNLTAFLTLKKAFSAENQSQLLFGKHPKAPNRGDKNYNCGNNSGSDSQAS